MKLTLLALFLSFFLTQALFAGPGKPVITGQLPLSVNEDQQITLELLYLMVEDPDDFYPFGFIMRVHPGENYTATYHTVTPAPNFAGTLLVNVTVNDGFQDSNTYQVRITVDPVNDAPVITGQTELSTIEETALTIGFDNLTVEDPDNSYPTGFAIQIQPGNNYTYTGTTLTPTPGFTGTLAVPVIVSDGAAQSLRYTLTVTVIPKNKKPIITGQKALSIVKNNSITLELSHLTIEDPDSKFPDEFTLIVNPGQNYSLNEKTVTPAADYVGTLTVKVAVNDGHSTSDVFDLKIEVQDKLAITGQSAAEGNEDEAFTPELAMLKVHDPENRFPEGYTILLEEGEHYTVSGKDVIPEKDFNGTLGINMKISNGAVTSDLFTFKANILPVNDAPELPDFPESPVKFIIGAGEKKLFEGVEITDADDTMLILVETGFTEGYQPGNDVLAFAGTPAIKSVFDSESGVLSLIGQAPLSEYMTALQSITYDYLTTDNPVPVAKKIYVKLNDGKSVSELYEREIVAGEDFELDIPTAFTPNKDNANDTWKVTPYRSSERYAKTIVRIFNDRGIVIFESTGFNREWDGTFGGEPVPEGSYLYSVDLNLNYETKRLTGTVTVLR